MWFRVYGCEASRLQAGVIAALVAGSAVGRRGFGFSVLVGFRGSSLRV